jgi:uncharacterized protein YbbC (DUF1343 family)
MVRQVKRSFWPLVMWLAACSPGSSVSGRVRPGIDVLLADSIHLVQGRRVGLLTNQTGVDRMGRSDVDLLRAAGLHLTAIFTPEHGFRGNLDRENIGNTVDSATGVPIFSLYGTVRAPTAEMLSGLEILLVDLQDIGARTYTYISTTLLALRSAKDHGRTVIVLDRPNPIGGELIQGPILDSAFSSFIGMLPIPLRHGLTLGELARYGTDRLGIGADLVVVPVSGWSRKLWFDQTALPWIRPSPNMPNLESATHYPGIVLFEATNLSVGRGTPVAFQVIAAPWLDPARVRNATGTVPGVTLGDTTVTPRAPGDGKYPDRLLPAVLLTVSDRVVYDPTQLAVRLLGAIRSVHGDSLVIQAAALDQRAGTDDMRVALERGTSADVIWASWREGLEGFRTARGRYLLYE